MIEYSFITYLLVATFGRKLCIWDVLKNNITSELRDQIKNANPSGHFEVDSHELSFQKIYIYGEIKPKM